MTDPISSLERDTPWMLRALELAHSGIGLCSPNPAVGCVILDRDGALAGEGWHEYDKLDHAEIVALKVAGERARGGTAYITLEPCNHTGRTGPCSQALLNAGISRVVAATTDPNPLTAGHGLETLRNAGVSVTVGVCQPEARRLNEGFAHWIAGRKPLVHMKVAMTLDGRIAPAPGIQQPRKAYWITGSEARAAVQPLRWAADAVLTGVDTVIADDPLMTDRSGKPRRRPLLRVILDSAMRIPLNSHVITTAQNDVLVFTAAPHERDKHANEVAQARIKELTARGIRVEVQAPESGTVAGSPLARVSLVRVLQRLGELEILTVLTETGTRLNTAFVAAGMVDRITIFSSPQIMGSDAVPAFRGLPNPTLLNPVEFNHYGNDFSISALLRDPWPRN